MNAVPQAVPHIAPTSTAGCCRRTSEAPYREWAHHAEVELAKDLPDKLNQALATVEWLLADLGGTSYKMNKKRQAGKTELGDIRPLAVLNAATRLRRIADDCEADAVPGARTDYSWGEIGSALGITKQAAHERLRHLAPDLPCTAACAPFRTKRAPRHQRAGGMRRPSSSTARHRNLQQPTAADVMAGIAATR